MVTRTRPREHDLLAHTADMGLRAAAADLPGLFEEAAVALGEIGADLEPEMDREQETNREPGAGERPQAPEGHVMADEPIAVRLRAQDLVGLTFAWLNELIGLADTAHAALAGTRVERVERVEPSTADADWELEARVWLQPFGGGRARPRLGVKSATLHRLAVEREAAGWSLVAYLDV